MVGTLPEIKWGGSMSELAALQWVPFQARYSALEMARLPSFLPYVRGAPDTRGRTFLINGEEVDAAPGLVRRQVNLSQARATNEVKKRHRFSSWQVACEPVQQPASCAVTCIRSEARFRSERARFGYDRACSHSICTPAVCAAIKLAAPQLVSE